MGKEDWHWVYCKKKQTKPIEHTQKIAKSGQKNTYISNHIMYTTNEYDFILLKYNSTSQRLNDVI